MMTAHRWIETLLDLFQHQTQCHHLGEVHTCRIQALIYLTQVQDMHQCHSITQMNHLYMDMPVKKVFIVVQVSCVNVLK